MPVVESFAYEYQRNWLPARADIGAWLVFLIDDEGIVPQDEAVFTH